MTTHTPSLSTSPTFVGKSETTRLAIDPETRASINIQMKHNGQTAEEVINEAFARAGQPAPNVQGLANIVLVLSAESVNALRQRAGNKDADINTMVRNLIGVTQVDDQHSLALI